jgi:hypothetical protein
VSTQAQKAATEEAATEAQAKRKPTEILTVTMDDGRIVEFAGKAKLKKETFEKDGVITLRLDFRNGETRTVTLHHKLLHKAAAHGISQKFGDEIAGIESVEDCVIAVDELHTRLDAGEWAQARKAGTGNGASLLVKALVAVTGKTQEEVKAVLANKTAAEKNALRDSPKVAAAIQKIQAEKAKASGIDTEALLAGF